MARVTILQELSDAAGLEEAEFVVGLLNEHGGIEAAASAVHVSQATVSLWAKSMNIKVESVKYDMDSFDVGIAVLRELMEKNYTPPRIAIELGKDRVYIYHLLGAFSIRWKKFFRYFGHSEDVWELDV